VRQPYNEAIMPSLALNVEIGVKQRYISVKFNLVQQNMIRLPDNLVEDLI